MQRYFSHICDGTDLQADWRNSLIPLNKFIYSDNTVIAKYMHKIAILPKLLGKNLQTCHMQFLMKIIRTKNFVFGKLYPSCMQLIYCMPKTMKKFTKCRQRAHKVIHEIVLIHSLIILTSFSKVRQCLGQGHEAKSSIPSERVDLLRIHN